MPLPQQMQYRRPLTRLWKVWSRTACHCQGSAVEIRRAQLGKKVLIE